MDPRGTVNVLLSTFPGLELPKTICLPLSPRLSTQDLLSLIAALLPGTDGRRLRLTTSDNRVLTPCRTTSLASLVTNTSGCRTSTDMLPVRMAAVLVGGKGGFGSQLRAAGGRMSSRKKRQNAELATGSARNLDGRRLRTITEAKNLATYLATKPEMDRKQKEERRRRWEQVIEIAEQREADMKAGKTADGRRKGLSEEWIEEKEEVGENVKNAVRLAMATAEEPDRVEGSGSDRSPAASAGDDSEDEDPMELDKQDMARLTREAEAGDADAIWVLTNKLKIPTSLLPKQRARQRTFAGFDDDDDDSASDEAGGDSDNDNVAPEESKGKTVISHA